MPRVSEAHLAARRLQIAEAAARCFARNGFHATSMQDVIREAGLSAGAVYRYFSSKEALVKEIASEAIPEIMSQLDKVLATDPMPPLDEIIDALLATSEKHLGVRLRLAVQVWGEALRNPELAEMVKSIYGGFRDKLTMIARRAREAGHLPEDSDDVAVGSALFSLLPGYLLQRLLLGDLDREQYVAGVRALLRAPTKR
ncbi:MAG: TetR family transcriptional regulator [Micromonosporaceae bacterium]|nr:TetR family transcriptional regulator [Micromonosporaceae bacterium]